MGIDYDGRMIVGALGNEIEIPDEFEYLYEFAEEHDMITMSLYYDADEQDQYIGFEIDDILVSKIDDAWISMLKTLAEKFETITGTPAKLVGTQNIW